MSDALLGHWKNTNPRTDGLRELTMLDDGKSVELSCEWGAVEAELYAACSDSADPAAFQARYDLDDQQIVLQANVKQGVLVIAFFTRFREGSGVSNFFSREFYHRATR